MVVTLKSLCMHVHMHTGTSQCLVCFPQVALAVEGSTMSGSLQRRKKSKRKWKRLWFLLKDKVLYTFTAREVREHRVSPHQPTKPTSARQPSSAPFLSSFKSIQLHPAPPALLRGSAALINDGILCALTLSFCSCFSKNFHLFACSGGLIHPRRFQNGAFVVSQDKVASESLPLQGFTVKLTERPEGEESSSVFHLYHKKTLYYTFRADDQHAARRSATEIPSDSHSSLPSALCFFPALCKQSERELL